MNYTSIRVTAQFKDGQENTIQILGDFLAEKGIDHGFCFGVVEKQETDNQHYHIMILDFSLTEAFSKALKRYFIKANSMYEDKGRGGKRKIFLKQYPMKEKNKGYQYLCKGAMASQMPVVVFNDDHLTNDEIVRCHEQYWRINTTKDIDEVKKEKKEYESEDKRFLAWFKESCLFKYKCNQQSIQGIVYHFPQGKMVEDILDFYNLNTKGYKRVVLEHKLHFLYNQIVREYEPDEFTKYVIYVHRELTQVFNFG